MKTLDMDDLDNVNGGLRVTTGPAPGPRVGWSNGGLTHGSDTFGFDERGGLYVNAGMHPDTRADLVQALAASSHPGTFGGGIVNIPGIGPVPGAIQRAAGAATGAGAGGGNPLGSLGALLGSGGPLGSLLGGGGPLGKALGGVLGGGAARGVGSGGATNDGGGALGLLGTQPDAREGLPTLPPTPLAPKAEVLPLPADPTAAAPEYTMGGAAELPPEIPGYEPTLDGGRYGEGGGYTSSDDGGGYEAENDWWA